jgi:hypothetical protein
MRNKTIIGSLILVIILAGSFFLFQPARAGSSTKGSVDTPSRDKARNSPVIWENLSQQFFSTL